MAVTHYQMASTSRRYFNISIPKIKPIQIVKQTGRELQCAPSRCQANNQGLLTHNRASMYQQTSWSHDYIESLETNFADMVEVMKLEEKVAEMLMEYENRSTLELLELVDDIERLGLGYRFRNNIRKVLDKLVASINETTKAEENNLHALSLRFRLLRDHGYVVSQDFVKRFKDNHGGFKGSIETDVKALLSLYEASYLALESESDLHDAKLFAIENLQKLSSDDHVNKVMQDHINDALDIPLYRRVQRLQARWYIDAYGKQKDANQVLLKLAVLDFNMVQSTNKRDLQKASKWWRKLSLTNELSFIRDRIVECFFWGGGMVFEPQYDSCRILLTKVCAVITTFDDIYDIYESLDELEALTNAIKRWDVNAAEKLPLDLQVGFLALYNTVNDTAYDTLITRRRNAIPNLAKVWGELCEAFLVEAKWTETNHLPSLEDYLDVAYQSASGVVILTHGFLSMYQDVKADANESLRKCQELFKWSSMLFRLYNDLVTSSEEVQRGDSPNAMSCYMLENGVSEEIAREYVKVLIDKAWMKMLEARVACSGAVADSIIDIAINLPRVALSMYQHGDGHGAPDARANDRLSSVIIKPITVT
ncbi:hypothetical protein QVD17_03705 [Tagetes erecta]|uniref:Uncharacterized protein n=1 Tax=Tagetes erecta TaxID=13708 RepID=A0AAD8LI08_TARER|nr:hypothetical protein QVD17_03705 [Tagetes erecta]